jgi:hypothetical protein
MPKRVILLLDEIDALCRVYVGKDAKGEPWDETRRRLERLSKLSRPARRYMERQKAKT